MLRLVEFPLDEGDGCPERAHGLAERFDHVGLVVPHELGAGDGHGRRPFDRAEQVRERIRMRCGVVSEEPEPFVVDPGARPGDGFGGGRELHRVGDGGPERGPLAHAQQVGRP